jgi:hypothetical protein
MGEAYEGARFEKTSFRGARFHDVDMAGIVVTETTLAGATIEADISEVTVNGFRIDELIDAELLRLYPERARLKATTPAGFRDALAFVAELRAGTLARVRDRSEEELRRPAPDGNWSIVENLRHLLFAEDVWVRRNAFGIDDFHPYGRPPSFWDDDFVRVRGIRADEEFAFADVVAALDERFAWVRDRFEHLTADELARGCAPRFDGTVSSALRVYLGHEWHHHKTIEGLA